MLYKNDFPYELSRFPKEVEALKKHFHNKFPVKVVYPPERIMKSRLKHNRLPDKPNSISVDFWTTVKTTQGTETWRYAETVTVDNTGKKRYSPKKFRFNGALFLDLNDIEKIYFLYKKSPYCKGGENQGKIVKFMFEDLVSEAEKKATKKAEAVKIANLLYGPKGLGLPMEKLREVAKAMFIRNIDSLEDAQVRLAVEQKIESGKDGARRFFSMIDRGEQTESRLAIQKVIDLEKLYYYEPKRTWFWKTDGERDKQACRVGPGLNAYEEIVNLYVGDREFREDVNALILTGVRNEGQDKKNGDEDKEDE